MGTYDAYRNIARIAAECEQRGWYEKAAEVWEKSLKLARAVDVPWIKTRMEFCTNAAARCWGNAQ
ncbi:ANR family transcriptional regulator [Serratia marcescens]|uniref:ANR family transcriptional regulator n=1 Tax=Serratia TaxID=613 RepID=UPI000949B01D|nr:MULTISPECIES: ANR family transcriptional regulator [Serratia]MBH2746393.1 ANR family transcriptional regulator [Serratia marcescens]